MAVIKGQVYGDATRDVAEATSRAEVLLHEAMPRPDVIEGITSFPGEAAAAVSLA